MKNSILFLVAGFIFHNYVSAQHYTAYQTGSTMDIVTNPLGGICMMGGASEDDNAMSWFLQRADGGDILVLRASGSDGYNNYLYSELGVSVNSVETIVFNNALASQSSYVHQKIQQAEAIWFAGGDQWNYVNYWRDTAIDSLINEAITDRNIVVGGTSAGMAILGGFYFSAQNGTVTSNAALSNPYNNNVTVDNLPFIANDFISDVVTDTHYDNPDRKGRHMVFLARIFTDYGIEGKGIACDEFTAVCIDENGIAKVFGEYPQYDDNAYFIQTNCELEDITPENCSPGNPLNWNLNNAAVKVYKIKGTADGANTFDLNDWQTGSGGTWENWYVENGQLNQIAGTTPLCMTTSIPSFYESNKITVYPNPSKDYLIVNMAISELIPQKIIVENAMGQQVEEIKHISSNEISINTAHLSPGIYFISSVFLNKQVIKTKFVKH